MTQYRLKEISSIFLSDDFIDLISSGKKETILLNRDEFLKINLSIKESALLKIKNKIFKITLDTLIINNQEIMYLFKIKDIL